MFEVKNRSVEAWGPLATQYVTDKLFERVINPNNMRAKDSIKAHIKKQKNHKTYKVRYVKEWESNPVEIQAENDYGVSAAAKQYFKDNEDNIGFNEKPRGRWADDYAGYDSIRYSKVR